MQKTENKNIVAVVSDLFFTVKINEAAKRVGLKITFVKTRQDAVELAREKPMLVIVDLNCDAAEPLDVIRDLKGNEETRRIPVISYLSHIQAELKREAQEAGSEMVLARSAFSQNLVQILQRNAGITSGGARLAV